MRVLGLINARGGSKGIPGKNTKPFAGKPLISWSIEAGLAAPSLQRTVVSTDSEEIAAVARASGADVPFMRPPQLASDTALQIDAIVHAVTWLEMNEADYYDAVAILQPTCPLRRVEDIEGTLQLLAEGADSAISVTEVTGQHPLTMYTEGDQGHLEPLLPADSAGVLRQRFPRVLWRNGAVYAIRRHVIETRSLYGELLRGYVMPAERSVNLDEPLDWILAEAVMAHFSVGGQTAEAEA